MKPNSLKCIVSLAFFAVGAFGYPAARAEERTITIRPEFDLTLAKWHTEDHFEGLPGQFSGMERAIRDTVPDAVDRRPMAKIVFKVGFRDKWMKSRRQPVYLTGSPRRVRATLMPFPFARAQTGSAGSDLIAAAGQAPLSDFPKSDAAVIKRGKSTLSMSSAGGDKQTVNHFRTPDKR